MISIKNIYSLLLTVYILASLLIPLASFNKLIFVVLVLIYGGYILFIKKEKKFECLTFTMAPVIIIAIFSYGYVRAIFGETDMALARQFLLSVSIFALIYPINEFDVDMQKILIIVAKIYILFFGIYAIYAINIMDYDLPAFIENLAKLFDNAVTRTIGEKLEVLGGGWISYRSFSGGMGMMIYLGSVSFLLVLISVLYIDFFKTKKITNLVWIMLGVLLSFSAGQRAAMLFIPLTLCVLTWLQLNRKAKLISAIIICLLGVIAFFYLLNYSSFFSLEDRSNSVKIGHAISYFNQLNLKQAFLGDGLGSFYYTNYSPEEIRLLAQTEVTFLDHCRYFGIPLSIVVWGSMVIPKCTGFSTDWKNWKIWKMKEELTILLIYFIWAQLNPVLFNSFGLIIVLWYWNQWEEKI